MQTGKVAWETDGSLDVLLTWLQAPGNYELWCRGSGRDRSKVLRDVLAELEKVGIRRSESSIRGKIGLLEAKCASTVEWMKKKGVQGEDGMRGAAGSDLDMKLQKRCPHYQDLMPVFHALGFGEKRAPNGKRGATEERRETKKKRRTEASVATVRQAGTDEQQGTESRHNAASVGVFCRGYASATNWYQERAIVAQTPFNFEPSTKFCKNLEMEQLSLTRELNKGVVSSEKKRHDQELETQKEWEKLALAERAVLSRHNLKKMGISADEIERGIPLPKP
jgi:hypothetical protein